MKRICFFISSISLTGGTERVCTEIANQLSVMGYQVNILSMYGRTPMFKLHPAIKIQAVFNKKHNVKLILPLTIYKIRRVLNHVRPDVLINADSALYLYSFISGLGLPFKNVVWEHFNFNVSLNTKIRSVSRKLAARYSDAIITLTQKDQQNWQQNLQCIAPVYTINNPTPFPDAAYSDAQRKPVVLSVGRLTHQKGFDRLLHAWKQVQERVGSDWMLHIVGSGESQQTLQQLTSDLGLNHLVKFIPATSNIHEHYQQSSVYCMASRFEGFGMVLIEAQSFGLPVVSYDCEAGPSEIITPNNGILVTDGDREALADALIRLMQSPDLRQQMGEAGYQDSKRYHINVIINKWIQLLESDLF